MMQQSTTDYDRIAKAIDYIRDHFKTQPNLETIAAHAGLSPFHFQRMFTEWAGVSPKKFLQYISLDYAKKLLKEDQATLFDTAYEAGLSGISRLHDLFITIEGMTPGEYKNGGEQLTISYQFAESPFGPLLIASTAKGICHISFADDEKEALTSLQQKFPNAWYQQQPDALQQQALQIFSDDWQELPNIKLHLKGTAFQLKVWETLLKIPTGKLASYGTIAKHIQKPLASRAVGTAIGDNPVAFLIPCHRVIQASGLFGDYHWGATRKTVMIGWEAASCAGIRKPKTGNTTTTTATITDGFIQ
jgi:AraC family transcriptional regulator of adaptative response/methylated-DNA-[protein]-cysteine methyltransferase